MIRNLIRVKRLGRLQYDEAYKIQLEHVARVLERRADAQTLLILEHAPVYTVGIRGADYGREEELRLSRLGADFVKTNRGGLVTFHGPGQLMAYPILDLNSFRSAAEPDPAPEPDAYEIRQNPGGSRLKTCPNPELRQPPPPRRILTTGGVKWYVAQLEGALVQTCYEAGVKSAQAPGFPRTGVWTGSGKKIASIGIHTRDAVTSHGIALNCDMDLKWFDHIVPCGLEGCQMTSLSQELGKRVSVDDATTLFLDAFKECLQCDLVED